MIRIWRWGDPTIPPPVYAAAWAGGDEDWVIAGPADDEVAFEFVCRAVEKHGSNFWNPEHVCRVTVDGVKTLVWCVCHA